LVSKEGRGGHNRKDYFLTLDMAKELSMVERNEKGKQAREGRLPAPQVVKTVLSGESVNHM
jgi:phage anti-repressor protein